MKDGLKHTEGVDRGLFPCPTACLLFFPETKINSIECTYFGTLRTSIWPYTNFQVPPFFPPDDPFSSLVCGQLQSHCIFFPILCHIFSIYLRKLWFWWFSCKFLLLPPKMCVLSCPLSCREWDRRCTYKKKENNCHCHFPSLLYVYIHPSLTNLILLNPLLWWLWLFPLVSAQNYFILFISGSNLLLWGVKRSQICNAPMSCHFIFLLDVISLLRLFWFFFFSSWGLLHEGMDCLRLVFLSQSWKNWWW